MTGESLVTTKLRRGLHLATLMAAMATLYGLAFPLLLANTSLYSSLSQQVSAFALLTSVGLVAGVLVLMGWLTGRLRWLMVAVVATASVLATTGIPADQLTSEAEWSYGVIGWFGMVLLLDRGRAAAAFLGAHNVVSFAQVILLGQDIAGMVVVAAIVLGCQAPVLAAAMALRRLADQTTTARREQEEVRTAEAVAEQLHERRLARYAELATTTVPLLERLATGSVRDRGDYAAEAAKLRRLFAEHDDVSDPLLHELAACVDLAERKGVAVYLGSCGDRATPPLPVRRALTEPVLLATSAAASEARVTVLGSPSAVRVSVVADVPAELAIAAAAPVTVTQLVDGKKLWVEATWQVPR